MKLFFALGPGDIVAAQRAQTNNESVLSEMSIVYSGQLFEYCREQGIEVLALSHNRRVDSMNDGLMRIENQPLNFGGRGALYHLSMIARAAYLAWRARCFGADLAIIDSGGAHYFALALFRILRIPVAINFHNTIWPNGYEPKRFILRLIRSLDAWFFRAVAAGAIGVSPECGRQVHQLAGPSFPYFDYRCQYRSEEFQSFPNGDHHPFRIIFAGRVEQDKGALDLPLIAKRLRERSGISFLFEVCGDGNALTELKQIVEEQELGDSFLFNGDVTRPELLNIYKRAHAVIVPTRTTFCEGLPKVCAEAVLSCRPMITSRLSNAVPILGPAIVEAEPENIESYVSAILRLAEDGATYRQLCDSCPELARQFFDRSQSLPAATDRLIARLFPSWKMLESYEPLFARIN